LGAWRSPAGPGRGPLGSVNLSRSRIAIIRDIPLQIPLPLRLPMARVGKQMPACAMLGAALSLFCHGDLPCRSRRRSEMAWKTPKIVEVPVGMEINMYACAARK
jgi:coenzyme PQQ precursor peptide PqqA